MSKAKPKRRARKQPQPPPPTPRPRRRPVTGTVRLVASLIRQVSGSVRVCDHNRLARRFLLSACIWIVVFGLLISIAIWQRVYPVRQVAMFDPIAGGIAAEHCSIAPVWIMLTTVILLFGGGPVLVGNAATRWIGSKMQSARMARPRWHCTGFWALWSAFALVVGALFLPGCSTQAGWQWNAPCVLTGGSLPRILPAEFLWFSGVLLAAVAHEMVVVNHLATLVQIRSEHRNSEDSGDAPWRIWFGVLVLLSVVLPIVMAYTVMQIERCWEHAGCTSLPSWRAGINHIVATCWLSWLSAGGMWFAAPGIAIVALAFPACGAHRDPDRTVHHASSTFHRPSYLRLAWWAVVLLTGAMSGTVVAGSLTAIPAIERSASQLAWLCEAVAWLAAFVLALVFTKWKWPVLFRRLAWVIVGLLSIAAAANHLSGFHNVWLVTLVPHGAGLVAWSAAVALATLLSIQRTSAKRIVCRSTATLCRIALITCVLIFIQANLGAIVHRMPITASHGAMRAVFVFHLVVAIAIIVHEAWLLTVAGWQFHRQLSVLVPVLSLVGLTITQALLGMMMWVVQFGWTSWLSNYRFAAAYTVRAARAMPVLVTTSHLMIGYSILAVALVLLLRIAHLQIRKTGCVDNPSGVY